ncbi:MAG: M18 family aminopeptidase [Clostridia bacterium]|nr:M18 family aminopeptidase [Clostridia bacterium]
MFSYSTSDFLNFLDGAHSPYHAVGEMKARLLAEGFCELSEAEPWNLADGGKYFVIRHASSLIAFIYYKNARGFAIGGAHTDSPSFRVKGSVSSAGAMKLDVEKYGGPIEYSWFDRPLTVAGHAFVRTEKGIAERLVYVDRDLCVIPSVAPHMSRQDSFAPNVAVDMPPVFALGTNADIMDIVAETLGVKKEDIISHELFLAQREKACRFGVEDAFILSRKIDDLGALYCLLSGLLAQEKTDAKTIPVLTAHDHEEVGSMSTGGAFSTFLHDILLRISAEHYFEYLASSIIVSADNGHAVHPNHPEYSDKFSFPTLGKGILIKTNSNRRYATDARSDAFFRTVCDRADVAVQTYFHRADRLCGSTIGALTTTNVSVPTVDIGLPQLAMHSAFEMVAECDVVSLAKCAKAFFATDIVLTPDGYEFG